MNKVLPNADAAAALVPDGASIMVGGFGVCGIPENLIAALHARGTRNLTIISNNAGVDGFGAGSLLNAHQVRKMICHLRRREQGVRAAVPGEARSRWSSCRRARSPSAFAPAAPASAASSRRPAYGTLVAEGKETRMIDGKAYVLEAPLRADFAFVQAWKGDRDGNLVYRRTARNFNPVMATAATDHDRRGRAAGRARRDRSGSRRDAGIFVQHILKGEKYERRIEKRTTTQGLILNLWISENASSSASPGTEGR